MKSVHQQPISIRVLASQVNSFLRTIATTRLKAEKKVKFII